MKLEAIRRGAHGDGERFHGLLLEGKVDAGPHRPLEPVVFHVLDESDDGDPRRIVADAPQATPDRIAHARPERLDERFIDDHRPVLSASIVGREEPAGLEADPHRAEIARARGTIERHRMGLARRARLTAFDVVEVPQWQPSGTQLTTPAASTPGCDSSVSVSRFQNASALAPSRLP